MEQITAALGEAEHEMPLAEISHKLGIGDVTFYRREPAMTTANPGCCAWLSDYLEILIQSKVICHFDTFDTGL